VSEAAGVAMDAVVSFLRDEASSIKEVVFVLYDDRAYDAYKKALKTRA
jgi:O-acetyl-ADP-ribose deacetylase (regulator of RNase III)